MQNILLSYLQISPAGTPQKKEEYHWINAGHVLFSRERACSHRPRGHAHSQHAHSHSQSALRRSTRTRARNLRGVQRYSRVRKQHASGYARNSNFASSPARVCEWFVGGYTRTRNSSPRADSRTFKMYYSSGWFKHRFRDV